MLCLLALPDCLLDRIAEDEQLLVPRLSVDGPGKAGMEEREAGMDGCQSNFFRLVTCPARSATLE